MDSVTPRGPWLPILPDADRQAGPAAAAAIPVPAPSLSVTAGDPGLRARVNQALDELAAALAAPAASGPAAPGARVQTLADGPAGEALFFHYLDQARPGQGHDERALAGLEAAIASTAEAMSAPGLYGGFSGVAWVLEHLTGRLLEPPSAGEEDPGEEVAATIASYLDNTPWRDDYDLISGLVGFGVWAVERAPRTWGEEAAGRVVRRLGELAERGPDGIAWRTLPERMIASDAAANPDGNFNLGVAHGVPGVIGVLGELAGAGLAAAPDELLTGAVEWLLRQPLPPGSRSCFAYSTAPGVAPVPARLAWCYGDLGISLALLSAARAAGEPEWERQALAIARTAAARPREEAGVKDGGLCHGAAGLAHLYNRLFQATRDPLFESEALAWIETLLSLRQPGGVAGWQAWRPIGEVVMPDPEVGWVADRGFLTGAAGIGLALLGAVSPIEPAWDRALLSSAPPQVAD